MLMDIFNTSISRKGTYCTQWDFCEDRFGVKDVLPFSISDMDLPIPEAIIRTLKTSGTPDFRVQSLAA